MLLSLLLTGTLCLCGLGMGYASWSGSTTALQKLSSGTLSFVADAAHKSSCRIVNKTGKTVSDISADTQIDSEGDTVHIAFTDAQALNQLTQGNRYLVFQFAIEAGEDGTFEAPQTGEVGTVETIHCDPADIAVYVGDQLLDSAEIGAQLSAPLSFEVQRSIVRREGTYYGMVHMQLTKACKRSLKDNPEASIDFSALPQSLTDAVFPEADGTGMLPLRLETGYRLELPFVLGQPNESMR